MRAVLVTNSASTSPSLPFPSAGTADLVAATTSPGLPGPFTGAQEAGICTLLPHLFRVRRVAMSPGATSDPGTGPPTPALLPQAGERAPSPRYMRLPCRSGEGEEAHTRIGIKT